MAQHLFLVVSAHHHNTEAEGKGNVKGPPEVVALVVTVAFVAMLVEAGLVSRRKAVDCLREDHRTDSGGYDRFALPSGGEDQGCFSRLGGGKLIGNVRRR